MAVVLHVYKEVDIVNSQLLEGKLKEPAVVTISYEEKPGMQALATTTSDRPPAVKKFATYLRDYEYKRLGTVSLLADLDLHTGRVTEIVSDHHASADFIARPAPSSEPWMIDMPRRSGGSAVQSSSGDVSRQVRC